MLTTLNNGWNQSIVLQTFCELDRVDFGFSIELKNQVFLKNMLNVILSWQTCLKWSYSVCIRLSATAGILNF